VKLTTHLHLVPSKNGWSYAATPHFMAWCSVKKKHRDNFIYTLNLKGQDHLEDLDIDGRIILERLLAKNFWMDSSESGQGTNGGLL